MKAKKQEFDNRKWRVRTTLLIFLMAAMGGFGWWWKGQVHLRQIQVVGARYADEAVLREMADVDTNMVFFDIDPYAIADRVGRHPWVREAVVNRLPNATLEIEVVEREPAMLVIDESGRPDRYLDPEGFQMPFLREAVYDVPLITGLREEMQATGPVGNENVKALLQVLGQIPIEVDALLSAFEVEPDGEITLETAPKPGRGAIHVRLGRGNYLHKLSKLHAFWHQAVLPKEDTDFELIDLRFDSQIITREKRLSQ